MKNVKAFIAILERLSKREKLIFYGALIVISVTILDRLILNPIASKIDELNNDIEEKELSIKRNLKILAHKDRILSESDRYSVFLSEVQSEKEEETALLTEIESIANESEIYLIDMKPRDSEDVGTSKKYIVTLTGEAQMEQVVEFMYKIESSEKLLTIEQYDISPKSRDSSVARCSMTISKLIMSE